MSELDCSLSVCPTKYTVNITPEFVNLCKLKCSCNYYHTETAIVTITKVKYPETEVKNTNAPGLLLLPNNLVDEYMC